MEMQAYRPQAYKRNRSKKHGKQNKTKNKNTVRNQQKELRKAKPLHKQGELVERVRRQKTEEKKKQSGEREE